MKITPFQYTDEAYAALIELRCTIEPGEQLTVELLRKEDQELSAGNQVIRVVGEINQHIIAKGSYWFSKTSADEPVQFDYSVHPDFQEGPIPSQMHNYLLSELDVSKAEAIVSEAKENETYRTRLLEESKFELKLRFPRSQLDVSSLEPGKFLDLMSGFEQQEIEYTKLTNVMEMDPNWQRNVWGMFTVIEGDVPAPESPEITPFEEYANNYEGESFRPDSWTIAMDTTRGETPRYVGMSVVNIMPTRPDTLYAGITGVLPSHRRRGIATILKVGSIQYAREQGYRYIYTDNEEDNPMYTLNLKLGFEPLPAWVYYKKQIKILE